MRFARYVFATAGVLGLIILIPQYFLERRIGLDQPPPITHPEFFYGFLGVAIAWQVAFLIIASDPPRYRLLMIPAMIEKFSFVAAIFTHCWRSAAFPQSWPRPGCSTSRSASCSSRGSCSRALRFRKSERADFFKNSFSRLTEVDQTSPAHRDNTSVGS